jgi:hypothetical protein
VGFQRAFLERVADERPLTLVVDNVWNTQAIEDFVPANLLPGSKVVITSRSACFERHSLVSGS